MVRNKQNSGKRSLRFLLYRAPGSQRPLVLFGFNFALPPRSPIIERGLEDCITRFKSATARTRCGEPGAHFLHLRRQLLDCSLLLRDCRLQFCDRLFLHFAGHESRGRPENPFEKARKRIATRGADSGDFNQHIVGQAVAVCVGG
jgi:hypothetical protein